MNPSPESTGAQAPPPQAGAEPAAANTPARGPGVVLTRPWLIALLAAAILASVGALASSMHAVFSVREASQSRDQLAAIHGELVRIRQILETDDNGSDDDVQAQQTARLSISGQPSLGSPNAPLTLVEFTDFQCPFCARFHNETFPLLRKAYVEPGRVRYVTMDFPLSAIHPEAFSAARASHCGEEQGRYWETHEVLYSQRGQLGRSAIIGAVKGLGLNVQRFSACLESAGNDARIQQGLSRGRAIGVRGTPTFVLGRALGGTVVGRVIIGAQPYEVFDDLIRAMLDMS